MINKPHIITIKLFTTGNLPTNAELEAMLSQQCFNFSLLSVELSPMRFDGVGLVPGPAGKRQLREDRRPRPRPIPNRRSVRPCLDARAPLRAAPDRR